MDSLHNRRQLLSAAIGGVLGAALLPIRRGFAQTGAQTGAIAREALSERVWLVTGAGSNVVVHEGPESLVLVDSGSPEHSDALLRFLDESFGGKPVSVLFNTHWHPQNTGANEALARTGAEIIAHENTRLWMGTEYYVEWQQKNYEPRPAAALPTRTFHASDEQPLVIEHAGQRIEYGHLAEAHTDGDIYVNFVDENVIAVGDTLWTEGWPVLDYSTGGWIGGLQSATGFLLELAGPTTIIVPGTDPVQVRAALQTQSAMLDDMRERIRLRIIDGKGVDEIVAENPAEGYEALGDPAQFVNNVYNGLWWGGRLRGAY